MENYASLEEEQEGCKIKEVSIMYSWIKRVEMIIHISTWWNKI
jgi:hypothetical protein